MSVKLEIVLEKKEMSDEWVREFKNRLGLLLSSMCAGDTVYSCALSPNAEPPSGGQQHFIIFVRGAAESGWRWVAYTPEGDVGLVMPIGKRLRKYPRTRGGARKAWTFYAKEHGIVNWVFAKEFDGVQMHQLGLFQ